MLGPLSATDAIRTVFDDRARITAMRYAKTALAQAEAQSGLMTPDLTGALASIDAEGIDLTELGRRHGVVGRAGDPRPSAEKPFGPDSLWGAGIHRSAPVRLTGSNTG